MVNARRVIQKKKLCRLTKGWKKCATRIKKKVRFKTPTKKEERVSARSPLDNDVGPPQLEFLNFQGPTPAACTHQVRDSGRALIDSPASRLKGHKKMSLSTEDPSHMYLLWQEPCYSAAQSLNKYIHSTPFA